MVRSLADRTFQLRGQLALLVEARAALRVPLLAAPAVDGVELVRCDRSVRSIAPVPRQAVVRAGAELVRAYVGSN